MSIPQLSIAPLMWRTGVLLLCFLEHTINILRHKERMLFSFIQIFRIGLQFVWIFLFIIIAEWRLVCLCFFIAGFSFWFSYPKPTFEVAGRWLSLHLLKTCPYCAKDILSPLSERFAISLDLYYITLCKYYIHSGVPRKNNPESLMNIQKFYLAIRTVFLRFHSL